MAYVNDAVIAILELRKLGLRVAYVDIDAHHGDGVQWAFYDSDQVLTISLHQHGATLVPGTGSLEEAGKDLENLIGELETRRDDSEFAGTAFDTRKGRLMWPCDGEVISSFGVETHPRFGTIIRNNGIDIKTMPGTRPIPSPLRPKWGI